MLKKIIVTGLLSLALSPITTLANPLDTLFSTLPQAGLCKLTQPDFCSCFFNASHDVCIRHGLGGLCSPKNLYRIIKAVKTVDSFCVTQYNNHMLPKGVTIAICDEQVGYVRSSCAAPTA